MKKIILSISIIAVTVFAQAQDNGISLQYGMATYNMTQLIDYQNHLINSALVTPRSFSNFPMYTNIKISYFKTMESSLRIGAVYNFSATGAHANVSDYSGYLDIDQELTAHQAGINFSWPLVTMPKVDLLAYGEPKVGLITNVVTEGLTVPSSYYYSSKSVRLNALTITAEAGLELNIHLKKVSLGIQGGYLFDPGAKYDYKTSTLSDADFTILPQNDIKSQLSGLRFGAKAIIWIFPEMDQTVTK